MYTFSVGVKQLPQRGRRMSGRSASLMVVVVMSNVPDGGGGGLTLFSPAEYFRRNLNSESSFLRRIISGNNLLKWNCL